MPEVDAQRLEYAEAVTAVVARLGLDATTLADIALETGVSQQVIARLFPSKSVLSLSAFDFVRSHADAAVVAAVEGHYGIDALRLFVLALLPLDAQRISYARVLVPLWQATLHDADLAARGAALTAQWRSLMRTWMREAMAEGEIRADASVDGVTEMVLNFVTGAQAAALTDAGFNSPQQLRSQLDALLHLLRG